MDEAWVRTLASSPWLIPALFALVVGDAFLVVLPSETVVVTLGALWGATGHPSIWVIVPVAALGAITGDLSCFGIGRRIGLDRWAWQRRGRVGAAIARARAGVHRRPAALIFTARYIPFARIAVNLAAGASGLPVRRFLPLAAGAGTAWAIYNTTIGALFGLALPKTPILAVVLSVVVAIGLGLLVDAITDRISRRRIDSIAPADPAAVLPRDE